MARGGGGDSGTSRADREGWDDACGTPSRCPTPSQVSNSWSSPSWVVRILDNEQVPHALVIDLKKKPQRAVYPKAGGVAKL